MEAKKFPNKTIESAKKVIFRYISEEDYFLGMSLDSHLHMLMIKLDRVGPRIM